MIGLAGGRSKVRRFHYYFLIAYCLLLDANQELGISQDAQARQIIACGQCIRYLKSVLGRAESRILNRE